QYLTSPHIRPHTTQHTIFPYTTLFRSLESIQNTVRQSQEVAAIAEETSAATQEVNASVEEQSNVSRQVNELAQALDEQSRSLNRSEEHTSELQSRFDLVCRLLLETRKR